MILGNSFAVGNCVEVGNNDMVDTSASIGKHIAKVYGNVTVGTGIAVSTSMY